MKINKNIILSFAFLLMMGPAYASACYTQSEAQAEQGIRIQSELMVIGLNCTHISGASLYAEYKNFNETHGNLIAEYEARLIDYYKRKGAEKPEKELHTLRTSIANNISSEAARMRPDIFCHEYAKRLSAVAAMDHEALEEWASQMFTSHPVSQPVCTDE